MATATETLTRLEDKKKADEHAAYMQFVFDVAAERPMNEKDYQRLSEIMSRAGRDPETFDCDVEAVRSRETIAVVNVDRSVEDKIHLRFLTQVEKYVADLAGVKAAPRTTASPTAERFDREIESADQSIATVAKILDLLAAIYWRRVNANGSVSLRGTLADRVKVIKFDRDDSMRRRTLLRQFELANPRLYRGDYTDTRPSWSVKEVEQAAAGQRPGGSASFLPGHSPLEKRMTENDPKPADPWAGIKRNAPVPQIVATPYRS